VNAATRKALLRDPARPFGQDEVNRAVYYSRGVHRYYLSRLLTPPENACLLKYQPYFAGRDVLDVGVGAGRTTRYLAPLARHYEAIDYSPVMVDYFKKTMPGINIRQADFRDLRTLEDRTLDFVFATDNVIDALSHQDRLRALSEACRVLRPGGVFAFSAHNIHYKRAFQGPRLVWSLDPVRLGINGVKYLLSWWNHLRIGPLRITTPEYALLNDTGHHYATLHYYLSRQTAGLQLANAGMRLIDVFDKDGRALDENDDDGESPSLTYVGQREVS